MKKNWLQIVSLVLNVVLLVSVIMLGGKLETYHSQLSSKISNQYNMLYNDLEGISSRIERKLEEGSRIVAGYALEPTGLDKTSRSLLANVSVTLKEWQADTHVTLLAAVGEQERTLLLTGDGNGTFTGALAVPVEQQTQIDLTANITSGGMHRREALGSWSEVSMLLPVQMRSWGGTAPVYRDGVLTIGQHNGDLEGRDGAPVEVSEICYRLYVNGENVKEEPVCENWLYHCSEGDEIRLTLFCRDGYGLGYEFTLDEFVCDEDANDRGTGFAANGETVSPILSWD